MYADSQSTAQSYVERYVGKEVKIIKDKSPKVNEYKRVKKGTRLMKQCKVTQVIKRQ